MGIKLTPKLKPASPDQFLKRSKDDQATLARFAHLNALASTLNDYAFYEIDTDQTTVVNITTSKGIIELYNISKINPGVACASAAYITLTSPDLPIGQPDNVYLQLTPYYQPAFNDNAVPHVVAYGAISGSVISIYNVSGQPEGASQWDGLFYIYYEIKSLV